VLDFICHGTARQPHDQKVLQFALLIIHMVALHYNNERIRRYHMNRMWLVKALPVKATLRRCLGLLSWECLWWDNVTLMWQCYASEQGIEWHFVITIMWRHGCVVYENSILLFCGLHDVRNVQRKQMCCVAVTARMMRATSGPDWPGIRLSKRTCEGQVGIQVGIRCCEVMMRDDVREKTTRAIGRRVPAFATEIEPKGEHKLAKYFPKFPRHLEVDREQGDTILLPWWRDRHCQLARIAWLDTPHRFRRRM
jgi:hypothetical protein